MPSILQQTYFGSSILNYIIFLVIILLSFFVGKAINYFVKEKLGKKVAKPKTMVNDIFFKILGTPFYFFIVLLGIKGGFLFLKIPENALNVTNNILSILFLIAGAWIIARILVAFIDHYSLKFTAKTESKLDDQLVPLINRIVKVGVFVITGIMVLNRFGYDISTLIAGLGIGGLAIAFAARETLADLFGGFSIFTAKPFQVGDAISVDSVSGRVEEIGLRYSKIRKWDGRITTIPNSKLARSIVENISTEPTRRVHLKLGFVYKHTAQELKKATETIIRVIKEQKGLDTENYRVTFAEFGESSLNFDVFYYITDLKNKFQIMHETNMRIKDELEKEGLEFAFPTQTVYLEK